MGSFLQIAAGVIIAALLAVVLNRQGKEIGLLLSIAACCMVMVLLFNYLKPVFQFLDSLEGIGKLDPKMIQILFKTVGISLIAEIASLICTDCGNATLGKAIQILGIGAVLWLSLPLLQALMELIQTMLGEV